MYQPADTANYTYGHTLSLHDALPFCSSSALGSDISTAGSFGVPATSLALSRSCTEGCESGGSASSTTSVAIGWTGASTSQMSGSKDVVSGDRKSTRLNSRP